MESREKEGEGSVCNEGNDEGESHGKKVSVKCHERTQVTVTIEEPVSF